MRRCKISLMSYTPPPIPELTLNVLILNTPEPPLGDIEDCVEPEKLNDAFKPSCAKDKLPSVEPSVIKSPNLDKDTQYVVAVDGSFTPDASSGPFAAVQI